MEEAKRYILREGELFEFEPYTKEETEISLIDFLNNYKHGTDELILSSRTCDCQKPGHIDQSGLLLAHIFKVLEIPLTEREIRYVNACNLDSEYKQEPQDGIPVFRDEQQYVKFINANEGNLDIQEKAMIAYKKQTGQN